MRRLPLTITALSTVLVGTFVAVQLGSAPKPAERTYMGQESCMEAGCHAGAYGEQSSYQGAEKFRETMHQKIHLRPSPETVVLEPYFAGDSVLKIKALHDSVAPRDILLLKFSKSEDKKDYFIQLQFAGGGDSTPKMKVAYTYGGRGWIERFLVDINGAYYVPPFQYILPSYKNRSPVGGRFYFIDRTRWFEVNSTSGQGQFLSFTSNKFRKVSWDNDCAACHLNGFDIKRMVTGTDTAWYADWYGKGVDSALSDQNTKIGCESCHGPGSEHAANPTASNIVSPSSFPDTFEGTELKYDLCNQCHNRISSTSGQHTYAYNDSLMKPYIPGVPMRPYIKSLFGQMRVHGDGFTSQAHHQQGQDIVSSGHYKENIFKNGCWSCHTAHQNGPDGLPYQLDRNWYSMKKGEGCLNFACHPTMGDTSMSPIVGRMVNTHTQHSQGVSQCINCHFSRVISIAFDTTPTRPFYDFSDHSFRVIRPNDTRRFASGGEQGMPNTCAANCHRNGRGQRNFDPSTPVAPAYGTSDPLIFRWKDKADLDLADSLWFHFKRIYPEYAMGVDTREDEAKAEGLSVVSAIPNPTTGATTLRYSMDSPGDMELEIYDITGRFVRTVSAGRQVPGTYSVKWDGLDDRGNQVVSGVYMARLTARGKSASLKIVVQR